MPHCVRYRPVLFLVVSALATLTTSIAAQDASSSPSPLAWSPFSIDTFSVAQQRAILSPPEYSWRAGPIRLGTRSGLPGDAIFVDWYATGGTGLSESRAYLVFPLEEAPPIVAWSGISHYHFYDNDGRQRDHLQTCIYILADTAFAYVVLHEPKDRDWAPPDSEAVAGVYRVGEHWAKWRTPVSSNLTARCRAERDSLDIDH